MARERKPAHSGVMSKMLRTRSGLIIGLAVISAVYGAAVLEARSHHIISFDVLTMACISMLYALMIFIVTITHLGARGEA